MSTHTPTPWNADGTYIDVHMPGGLVTLADCARSTRIPVDVGKANAAFIVKAVNCHDELVAALKQAAGVLATPEIYTEWPVGAVRMAIEAALSRAEAA